MPTASAYPAGPGHDQTAATASTMAGDPDELFRATYPVLAGWVRRLVDDDDSAHEIASESFVRLLSRWTRAENPRGYLYMIAANLVADHWRKKAREGRAIARLTAGAERAAVTFPAQDIEVRDLLQSLPARLREPFLLHYYGGFPVQEIAALVRRPAGTVKADLFAARARLRAAAAWSDD